MSRFPFRNLFRISHSGVEKIAIACAALGMMHATAHASETQTSAAPADDPWINRAAPQDAFNTDAWGSPKTQVVSLDDAWSAPHSDRAALQASNVLPIRIPEASTINESVAPTPRVMDTAGRNDEPRGRAPGLIASNNAWRNRPGLSTGVAEKVEPVGVQRLSSVQDDVMVAGPAERPGSIVAAVAVPARTVSKPTISNNAWVAPMAGAEPSVEKHAASFDVSSHWNFSRTRYAWMPRIRGGMRFNGAGMPLDTDVIPANSLHPTVRVSATTGTTEASR